MWFSLVLLPWIKHGTKSTSFAINVASHLVIPDFMNGMASHSAVMITSLHLLQNVEDVSSQLWTTTLQPWDNTGTQNALYAM